MQKAQGANGFFDDGFTFIFTETNPETEAVELKPIRPRHISFQIYTSDQEGESCDLRLYSVDHREGRSEESKTETDNGSDAVTDDPDEDDLEDQQDDQPGLDDQDGQEDEVNDDQTDERRRRLQDEDENLVGDTSGVDGDSGEQDDQTGDQ